MGFRHHFAQQQFERSRCSNGSKAAAPVAGARCSYGSDNGHESGRLGELTRDEAFLIAVNIAKLPSVPRQILKDIPRPPKTASRDD
jgi:hypothetical protein